MLALVAFIMTAHMSGHSVLELRRAIENIVLELKGKPVDLYTLVQDNSIAAKHLSGNTFLAFHKAVSRSVDELAGEGFPRQDAIQVIREEAICLLADAEGHLAAA